MPWLDLNKLRHTPFPENFTVETSVLVQSEAFDCQSDLILDSL
jgi:hypothetical protein